MKPHLTAIAFACSLAAATRADARTLTFEKAQLTVDAPDDWVVDDQEDHVTLGTADGNVAIDVAWSADGTDATWDALVAQARGLVKGLKVKKATGELAGFPGYVATGKGKVGRTKVDVRLAVIQGPAAVVSVLAVGRTRTYVPDQLETVLDSLWSVGVPPVLVDGLDFESIDEVGQRFAVRLARAIARDDRPAFAKMLSKTKPLARYTGDWCGDRDKTIPAVKPAKVATAIAKAGSVAAFLGMPATGDFDVEMGQLGDSLGLGLALQRGPHGGEVARLWADASRKGWVLLSACRATEETGAALEGLTVGPDGRLWYTESGLSRIGAIAMDGSVTEYGTGGGNPGTIVSGRDGNLWFGERFRVGTITPGGTVTRYALPDDADVGTLTVGPDDSVWFSSWNSDLIGKITRDGATTVYTVGADDSDSTVAPSPLEVGPDGNVWFAYPTDRIGKVTPTGTLTMYAPDTEATQLATRARPLRITAGPDGRLWYSEESEGTDRGIGAITPDGTVTHYGLGREIPASSGAWELVPGPDGNLWFAAGGRSQIGAITASGKVTEYSLPDAHAYVSDLAAGPDGNVWFVAGSDRIGKITPKGTITEYRTAAGAAPSALVAGPDGNVWFLEPGLDRIGTITRAGTLTEYSCHAPPTGAP